VSVYVLGTDVGVGKTVTCALLLQRWGNAIDLAYWQPIATRGEADRDLATVAALCTARVDLLPETYLLRPAVSPHLAARREGLEIDPERVLEELARHRRVGRGLVVEAAGGLLEPLTDWGYTQADLISRTRLRALLVARTAPGTLNHTLLTLEALRRRHVPVAGVVLAGPRDLELRAAVERLGEVPVLLEIEPLAAVTAEAVARAAPRLDPRGVLAPLLAEVP
jgi:dethiobiotin synthase